MMNKPISEKILELRKSRSLTQEKLGSMLGISSQAVSKWENGENLPDLTLLPQLCEILGVTADALLEVPASVKKESCMTALSQYAKEVGERQALFEAIQACSCATSEWKGSAQTSDNGLRVNNTRGLAILLSSKEMVDAVRAVDAATIRNLCGLLCDEATMQVFRALNFSEPRGEEELAAQCGLSQEEIEHALFKLMRMNLCEGFIDGKYLLGVQSYVLFSILAGMYLATADGHKDIYSISRDFNN